MSGGDNIGIGSGGGFSNSSSSCESLVIKTLLTSPKEDVVKELTVGTILDVEVQGEGSSFVVCLLDGRVAGGVLAANMHRLRECIDAGTIYIAEVQDVMDGQVRVIIKAV